jgi:hypothetical protein
LVLGPRTANGFRRCETSRPFSYGSGSQFDPFGEMRAGYVTDESTKFFVSDVVVTCGPLKVRKFEDTFAAAVTAANRGMNLSAVLGMPVG